MDNHSDDNSSSGSSPNRSPVEPTRSTREHLDGGGSAPRSTFVAKVILGAVVVVTIAAGMIYSKRAPQPASRPTTMVDADSPAELSKRSPVTDFILTDESGQTKKLSDYKGKVVIVSFWASWCAPCLEELPTFGQLIKDKRAQGLEVLPVNVEEGDVGKAFAKKFWAAQKFELPSFYDTSKALASQFQVDMLPANFVIDREGRLAFSGFGANDWTEPETLEFLDGLLQEKPGQETVL